MSAKICDAQYDVIEIQNGCYSDNFELGQSHNLTDSSIAAVHNPARFRENCSKPFHKIPFTDR